jgi:hypothetical protein
MDDGWMVSSNNEEWGANLAGGIGWDGLASFWASASLVGACGVVSRLVFFCFVVTVWENQCFTTHSTQHTQHYYIHYTLNYVVGTLHYIHAHASSHLNEAIFII